MDLTTLLEKSPKVMSVVQAIKNDPNLLTELQENPEATLQKLGVELNEEELGVVQKIASIGEFKDGVESLLSKVKGFLGF